MADPAGTGSNDDLQAALDGALTTWSDAHPGTVGRFAVDGVTLQVTVDGVARGLPANMQADLAARINVISPTSTVTFGDADVSQSDLDSLLADVRADLSSARASYGVTTANINDAGTGIVAEVESQSQVAEATARLQTKYGELVTVAASTFRTESRDHDRRLLSDRASRVRY